MKRRLVLRCRRHRQYVAELAKFEAAEVQDGNYRVDTQRTRQRRRLKFDSSRVVGRPGASLGWARLNQAATPLPIGNYGFFSAVALAFGFPWISCRTGAILEPLTAPSSPRNSIEFLCNGSLVRSLRDWFAPRCLRREVQTHA